MTNDQEREYLKRREAQAVLLADGATDRGIRAIHFKMAESYAERLAGIEQVRISI